MVNTKKGGLKGERVRSQPIRPQIKFPREYLDQVISNPAARTATGACTWSGPQVSSTKIQGPSFKQQASSTKPQAPSSSSNKRQASSPKLQASSSKPEATSSLMREPRNMDIEQVLEVLGPRASVMINVFFGCLKWNAI